MTLPRINPEKWSTHFSLFDLWNIAQPSQKHLSSCYLHVFRMTGSMLTKLITITAHDTHDIEEVTGQGQPTIAIEIDLGLLWIRDCSWTTEAMWTKTYTDIGKFPTFGPHTYIRPVRSRVQKLRSQISQKNAFSRRRHSRGMDYSNSRAWMFMKFL